MCGLYGNKDLTIDIDHKRVIIHNFYYNVVHVTIQC